MTGSWTVPAVNCSVTPNGGASIWVGIGGESETLLQTGTREACINGSAYYAGWFEEFPSDPNREVDFDGFPVSPGDPITASVYQTTTGAWVTRLDDLRTELSGWMVTGAAWGVGTDASGTFSSQGFTTGLSYAGGHTAEWIVEDYAQSDGSVVTLADYGSVTFTGLRTSLASWSLVQSEGEEIVQNGVAVSTPSLPGSDDDSFSVSYTAGG